MNKLKQRLGDDYEEYRADFMGYVIAPIVLIIFLGFAWIMYKAVSEPRPVDVTCENYYGKPVRCPGK